MCVSSPPTHTHIHIATRTHSLVRLRRPGCRAHLTSHARERMGKTTPFPGVVLLLLPPPPPKTRGQPPFLVRKAAGRWELATSTAPCQTHLREINYGMESAQSLWDVPLPSTGPPGLGSGVGGDPSEGGRVGGAGTQVGAGKMALEKVVELVMGPNRLEKNHSWGSWWD